jgi:competence protein ComEA
MKITFRKEWIAGLIMILILALIYLLNAKTPYEESIIIPEETQKIEVYINGAVINPGVYELEQGQRMNDLLESAGGFNENADQMRINLARKVEDGEMIWIYEKSEESLKYVGVDYFNYESKENILEVEGIGETIGDRIISFRENGGYFNEFDDLLEIEGIGEQKLKAIINFLESGN